MSKSEGNYVTLDELRVSNVARYPFGHVSKRTFVPAEKPFTPDEKTLILHHFEDTSNGESAAGKKVPFEFVGF